MTDAQIAARAEQLAEYVRKLGGTFEVYKSVDSDYHDHIGATIADAILQANRNYEKVVRPRVTAILKRYAECRTTAALNELLKKIDITDFLNYRSPQREQRFRDVLHLLTEEKIDSTEGLRNWLLRQENLPKLRKIKGIGPKTVDYFKILAGLETVAIDTRLQEFLDRAEVKYYGYDDTLEVIKKCADLLCIGYSNFDHSIWLYIGRNQVGFRRK
jgi:hypothetical protein